jgi:hypothetical protein
MQAPPHGAKPPRARQSARAYAAFTVKPDTVLGRVKDTALRVALARDP